MKFFRPTLFAILLACADNLPSHASMELARALNDAFAQVYEKVAPSVVVIEVRPQSARNSILPDGWEFFFRSPRSPHGTLPPTPTQGSGVILSSDGLIVTNHHVISSADARGISVILKDGRRLPATIVGVDDKTDLAVLQIEANDLPAAMLGDSDAVRVGQFAFALGAPMELPYTFTFGVVSATERSNLTRTTLYENYIQTDAAINPGNSGGPLVDIDGKVIGINTMISGINRGLGFAIPINMVKDVVAQLVQHGEVIRPWLGISIAGLDENERLRTQFSQVPRGVVVQAIFQNAPASRSELRAGDVILRVDDTPVRVAWDVQRAVLRRSVGDEIALDVWRAGKERRVIVKAGRQPADPGRAAEPPALLPVPPDAPSTPSPESKEITPESLGLGFKALGAKELEKHAIENVPGGLLVTGVRPGSAAEASGIQEGDIILEANYQAITTVEDFLRMNRESDPSRGLLLTIAREGTKTFVILKP